MRLTCPGGNLLVKRLVKLESCEDGILGWITLTWTLHETEMIWTAKNALYSKLNAANWKKNQQRAKSVAKRSQLEDKNDYNRPQFLNWVWCLLSWSQLLAFDTQIDFLGEIIAENVNWRDLENPHYFVNKICFVQQQRFIRWFCGLLYHSFVAESVLRSHKISRASTFRVLEFCHLNLQQVHKMMISQLFTLSLLWLVTLTTAGL